MFEQFFSTCCSLILLMVWPLLYYSVNAIIGSHIALLIKRNYTANHVALVQ